MLHFYLTLIPNCRNKRQSFSNTVVVGCDLDYFLLFFVTLSYRPCHYIFLKEVWFYSFSFFKHSFEHASHSSSSSSLFAAFSLIFVCSLETWKLWGFSLNYLQSLPGMTIEWVAGRAQCAKRLSRISPISSSTCESSTEARTCRRRRVTFAARCSNTSIHCRRTCTHCIARLTLTPN